MVLIKDQIIRQIAPLIIHGRENTNVYFVGSLSDTQNTSFNPRLSDIDLLFTPVCNSLDDYVSNFEQVMRINTLLNQPSDRLVESFMMSSRLAPHYFKILPVLAGSSTFKTADLVFGEGLKFDISEVVKPSEAARRGLYGAKSLRFCDEYAYLLPVADTGKARKTAKMLFRGMEFMICAKATAEGLSGTETNLMKMNTFDEVLAVFSKTYDCVFTGDTALLQKTLDGETIEDWAAWMVVQEEFAQLLVHLNRDSKLSVDERRFSTGLSQVRDLLYRDLKNILSLSVDEDIQNIRVGEFADDAASATVKLALAGVTSLGDLEVYGTPSLVKEGYGVMVEHLKGEVKGLRVLAAAVVVLEYAFEQALATLESSR
jgi:hypothetical protein